MSRDIVRERALSYLEEALRKNDVTNQVYQDLLAIDYTEDLAKEHLAFVLEKFLKRNILEDEKNESALWEETVKQVKNDPFFPGDELLSSYKLERLPQRVRKEILNLSPEFETENIEFLGDLEQTFAGILCDLYQQYDLSSKDGRKIIMLAIADLYGKTSNIEYDVSEAAHIDEILIAEQMLQQIDISCNPELRNELEEQDSDLDYSEQMLLYDFFLLALYGLYRTIELYDRMNGTNSFFRNLTADDDEEFIFDI